MASVILTPQYRLVLNRWTAGLITIRQVELFVKTEWLTRDHADLIYTYPRAQTPLVAGDPYSAEAVESYRLEAEIGA